MEPNIAEQGKPKTSRLRWGAIIGGTIVAASIGIVLQLTSSVAQDFPIPGNIVVLVNIVVGVGVGFYALFLSTDEASQNSDPKVVKGLGIAVGIYALAQAIMALFILCAGK